jgi:predicted Zn-dependent peptidase
MTVDITKLDNGLTVATDAMPHVETVSLGAWVGVGTRHEPAEFNGVAHLLEHMAFKGTARRSARDIAEEIEAVGGYLNAYTGRESTAYHAKVLDRDLPLAMDILADILQHSTFDEDELARERQVILQEIGQAVDTPDDIIFDHFHATAYPEQALGRPVLGTPEVIAGIGPETLRTYMSRHYGADSIVLSAAGNVDHDRFVDLAAEHFSELRPVSAAESAAAAYAGGDFRESRELEQVHLILGFPGVSHRHPDFYAANVLSTLFGGGMSSRLFQELRETRGLVYNVFSFLSSYSDSGIFGIYAGTGENEVRNLIPVVCDELARLTRDVSEEETDRARAQLRASILMSRESTNARCEQLATQIQVFGRPLPPDEIVQQIDAVDVATIARLAGDLATGEPTMASLGPIAGVEPLDRVAARLAA